jgi:predicted LPLAT superfamily acyltransferase
MPLRIENEPRTGLYPLPVVKSEVKRDHEDARLYQSMSQAVGFLEKALTTHYDQWMNFFDFWPDAPLN